MNWRNGLKGKILFDEPLSKRTALKIGPKAKVWVEPYDLDDLKLLLKNIKALRKDYLLIGLGSNIFIKKKSIPLVIRLGQEYFKGISARGNVLKAGCGVSLKRLIDVSAKRGLGGLEFLSGIPGTLGGALVMNAGVTWPRRRQIQDVIQEVEALDRNGRVRVLKKKDIKFAYRASSLSKYIVISASLNLKRKRVSLIQKDIRAFLNYRRGAQDYSDPSLGCVFKNPDGQSAGRLIDLCGLKGKSIGGAAVSKKHANFLLNYANASAGDFYKLIKFVQKEVKKKFGIALETEILIV